MLTASSTGSSKCVNRTRIATATLVLCSISLTSVAQVAAPSAPAPALCGAHSDRQLCSTGTVSYYVAAFSQSI